MGTMTSAPRMRSAAVGVVAGVAAMMTVSVRGEAPADRTPDPIANTARSVPATPPDTIIEHRPSPAAQLRRDRTDETVLPSKSAAGTRSSWSSDGGYWLGLLSLCGVLALIFGISLLAKRFVLPRTKLGKRNLEVIGRTYLSGKQSVALVQAGRRLLVLGITPSHITRLACVDDPLEMAELLGAADAERPDSVRSQFARNIKDEMLRFNEGDEQESELTDAPPEFSVRAREQIRSALERVRRLGRRRAVEERQQDSSSVGPGGSTGSATHRRTRE